MKYYLAIQSIRVDVQELLAKEHQRTFRYGEEVSGVPAGALASMIRLRQVVTARPETAEPETIQPAATDWRQMPAADLAVSKSIKAALAELKLNTVAEVLAYGSAHEEIPGLTEAKEKALQQAIEKIST